MSQKCVKNARNTFGGEHLLDDTDYVLIAEMAREGLWLRKQLAITTASAWCTEDPPMIPPATIDSTSYCILVTCLLPSCCFW